MIKPSFAYLDPGTGATIVQLALAGTAGIAAAGKLRMNKIKRRLARDAAAEQTEHSEELEEPAPAE
ncbi:MAG: hypothetical protein U9N84_10085 [Actinomycetota bacterium]|nr:hypothetical protein [Actinomycetota bacterium]